MALAKTLSKCVSAVVAIGLMAGALVGLWHELRTQPLQRLAASVAASPNLPKASDRLQGRLTALLEDDSQCREGERRARVTAALFLLRLPPPAGPKAPTPAERLALARATVDDALRCNPLDGDLWVAEADLGRLASLDPAIVRGSLARSIAFAPFEGSVLDARWSFLLPLGRAMKIETDPAFQADLASQFRFGDARRVVGLDAALTGAGFTALAAQAKQGLDPRRVTELGTAAAWLARRAAPARR